MSKQDHGRFDPKNPAVQELAAKYDLTPEEYLASPTAHSGGKVQSNTLDTTVDEWRAEMDRLAGNDPGMTLRELMKELGLKKTSMQDRLRKLIETGRLGSEGDKE